MLPVDFMDIWTPCISSIDVCSSTTTTPWASRRVVRSVASLRSYLRVVAYELCRAGKLVGNSASEWRGVPLMMLTNPNCIQLDSTIHKPAATTLIHKTYSVH